MIRKEVEEMKKNKNKSHHDQPLTISSLPEEILEHILARISKWNYPNLSLVSKRFLSLLSSPQIYTTRSNIGTTEPCLYFCLQLSKNQSFDLYTLWMTPSETLTNDGDDDIPGDYSLVAVPCYPHPHCVPYDFTSVAVGSEIYLIGAPSKSPPAVRILDCGSNTWRDGPNMMVARKCAKAVFVDGKIFVMGGYGKLEFMAWTEVLDIKTQTWSSLPSHGDSADELSSSEEELEISMLEVEGKIYAMDDPNNYAYCDMKKGTLEVVVVETHSSMMWIYAWCVIENVVYGYTDSNICMWYELKSRKWREVKGSNLELLLGQDTCCLAHGFVLDLVNYGGKLLVLWMTVHVDNAKQIKRIRCAKMALEKRHGGEDWGKMEWANTLLMVPESFEFLSSCVVVSI
ncbi:PREDICTED: F-box/kelch-repeat protein At5g39560-like [Camelina sativa]|uniref:F-box/kelch-repeat protein At5g39560-like n=1 Tax=Camelina sativa TaxID=90675 RepID=A0ABM0U5Y7_CAMSA|nr:PREDICTED: F-box/kelch-repeat protein At5g39560-like [Camelina sativa]